MLIPTDSSDISAAATDSRAEIFWGFFVLLLIQVEKKKKEGFCIYS